MAIRRLTIKEFLLQSQGQLVLDVRSPGEYGHAHVPGALTLPLFSDEERKQVGTAYKQQSREAAIRIGLDFFGPKMRGMVEEVEKFVGHQTSDVGQTPAGDRRTTSDVFLYCWRGGMRSGAVAWLLDLYGFRVFVLSGGYKAFRNEVLDTFNRPFHLKILGGFTGSAKTEVLQELGRRGIPVIDLEGIACHKGSAFGNFNMPPQPTQEMFENQIAVALWHHRGHTGSDAANKDRAIWLEDESQRIGNLNVPGEFWQQMRNAPILFLEVPFEERLDYLVREYGTCSTERLVAAVERISKRLGGLEAKNTTLFLEEGNVREAFRILLKYYDKQYLKGLHSRAGLDELLTKVPCTAAMADNARLLFQYQTV